MHKGDSKMHLVDEILCKLETADNMTKNQLENKKEKDKPAALLKKAFNALSEIDIESLSSASNKLELVERATELQALLQGIKTSLSN